MNKFKTGIIKAKAVDLGVLQANAESAIKAFNAAGRAYTAAANKLTAAEEAHRTAQAALRGGFATVAQSTKASI